ATWLREVAQPVVSLAISVPLAFVRPASPAPLQGVMVPAEWPAAARPASPERDATDTLVVTSALKDERLEPPGRWRGYDAAWLELAIFGSGHRETARLDSPPRRAGVVWFV